MKEWCGSIRAPGRAAGNAINSDLRRRLKVLANDVTGSLGFAVDSAQIKIETDLVFAASEGRARPDGLSSVESSMLKNVTALKISELPIMKTFFAI